MIANYAYMYYANIHRVGSHTFCTLLHSALNIFQKVVFGMSLYSEEVYLQTSVMIQCITYFRNYLKVLFYSLDLKKKCSIFIFPIAIMAAKFAKLYNVGSDTFCSLPHSASLLSVFVVVL